MSERAFDAARESGLIREGEPLLVLLSGGADSTCLLDVAVRLGARMSALHVNYGLREGADADEEHCRALCSSLGVELHVEGVQGPPGSGNLQAWARDVRYANAERVAAGDYAAAHTASDQAETVLYRLAVSPGRRALLGMAPRRGRLVRPLLRATREDTRDHCRSRGLEWREDPSNEDPRFARSRVRGELLPVLRSLSPAAERTIAETAQLLRDETEVLERAVDDAQARLVAGAALPLAELRGEPAAVRRLLLRRMAETAAGRERALSREDCDRILGLGDAGGTRQLDLGEDLRAVVEYGTLRFALGPDAPPPDPVRLPVPGAARFGELGGRGTARRGGGGHRGGREARAAGHRARLAGGRPDATRRAWAGRRRCRTCSRTARSHGRCGARSHSWRRRARSSGWPGWRSTSGSPPRRGRGRSGCPRVDSPAMADAGIGEILVQRDDLTHRVRQLAEEISRDYAGRDLLLVGVLKGAVFFLSDLMRHLTVPVEVDFMAVSSYGSSTDSSGVVRILKDLDRPIEGREVLIVEDIVDSGLTLSYLLRTLRAREPKSLEVCALLTKPERRKVELPIRYVGFEIPNRFVIGYGLDHAERFRNLPYVAVLKA